MFEVKIENTLNAIITLTGDEGNFQLYNITGLNPPKAQINTSKIAGMDGGKYNSSKLNERNIVIYIKLRGDIEKNRLLLYSFFPTKEWCKFYYKNGSRDVYIEGYAETCEVTPFTNNEVMQVSLLCPQPYFKAIDEIIDDVSKVIQKFKFPFSINVNQPIPISTIDTTRITDVYNDSETQTGIIIEAEILGTVNALRIVNTSTGEIFEVKYPFKDGDVVTINTNKGEKSIRLLRDGIVTNIFTSISRKSTFFQLNIGDNYFSYLADNGSSDGLVHIVFKHYTMYRGV